MRALALVVMALLASLTIFVVAMLVLDPEDCGAEGPYRPREVVACKCVVTK